MDEKRKVYRQIEPLDEDELDTDLRFLFHNRGETADQFVEEAIPVMKYHVNLVMEKYQDRLLRELTNSLQGEIAGVMLRVRRDTVYHPGTPIGPTEKKTGSPKVDKGGKNGISSW